MSIASDKPSDEEVESDLAQDHLQWMSRRRRALTKALITVCIILFLSPSTYAYLPFEGFCSEINVFIINFHRIKSVNDPKVNDAIELHESLCRQVSMGSKNLETAKEQFRSSWEEILLPIAYEWKNSEWYVKAWKLNFLYPASVVVGRDSAIYWASWFLAFLLLIVPIVVVSLVGWGVRLVWGSRAIYDFIQTVQGVLLLALVLHFIAFLILLAGGVFHFLKIIGAIVGIIATIVGIAVSIRSLFAEK